MLSPAEVQQLSEQCYELGHRISRLEDHKAHHPSFSPDEGWLRDFLSDVERPTAATRRGIDRLPYEQLVQRGRQRFNKIHGTNRVSESALVREAHNSHRHLIAGLWGSVVDEGKLYFETVFASSKASSLHYTLIPGTRFASADWFALTEAIDDFASRHELYTARGKPKIKPFLPEIRGRYTI